MKGINMKFAPFIYEYVAQDNWEFLENMLGFRDTKEFFGFDVPFTEEDLNNENWESFRDYLENWVEEHQLKVIDSEVIHYDLEKSYEEVEVVFSFDGKYYKTEYIRSVYVGPFEHGYPKDTKEVFPHTKTITVTKYH